MQFAYIGPSGASLGGRYIAVYHSAGVTTGVSATAMAMDSEMYDIGNNHDPAVNNSRITMPSYWANRYVRSWGQMEYSSGGNYNSIRKNGSNYDGGCTGYLMGVALNIVGAPVVVAAADYFEMYDGNVTGNTVSGNYSWLGVDLLPTSFAGALVGKTAVQAIAASTWSELTWDSEVYDTSTIHDNATNNMRLTVPSGATLVRVNANVEFSNDSANDTGIRFKKNGGTAFCQKISNTSGISTEFINACSPPMVVTAGDYFTVDVYVGTALNAVNGNRTWFCLEVLDPAVSGAHVGRVTSADAISSGGGDDIIGWNTELYDTGGWHDNSTNNSRLTVPSGVNRVRCGAYIAGDVVAGTLGMRLLKNGAAVRGAFLDNAAASVLASSICAISAVLEVSPGDYLECAAFSTNANNANIVGSGFWAEAMPGIA